MKAMVTYKYETRYLIFQSFGFRTSGLGLGPRTPKIDMALRLEQTLCLGVHHSSVSASRPMPRRLQISKQTIPSSFSSRVNKRRLFLWGSAYLIGALVESPPFHCKTRGEEQKSEETSENKGSENDEGLLGGLKALLDPNGKTKSGRILPKNYLKNANDIVKNLRETLKEDTNDAAKFRRTADSAKDSIKAFLKDWTNQKSVASEESYVALMKAIRLLADFYSKKGPTATLSSDIKSKLTEYLDRADSAL
eukprot:TRINITY_DN2115_c0_g1_i2.p1 TRINITY_DN2115_c0_g1~~TRINITY_DN2115_c0_g1_i2.p1  ORF type:complete len:250 (-),score=25.81 TRINITY_DN2115_c0_g1_i2:170-919(-)